MEKARRKEEEQGEEGGEEEEEEEEMGRRKCRPLPGGAQHDFRGAR